MQEDKIRRLFPNPISMKMSRIGMSMIRRTASGPRGSESRSINPLPFPHCVIKYKRNFHIKGDFQNEDGEDHARPLFIMR